MAFFITPGMPRLYSGVTKRTASAALTRSRKAVHSAGGAASRSSWMDRFDEISASAAVADARSFTHGARRLGVSSAQVYKLVARLENRLGARLLNRTTRDVSLTDTGRAYLERAKTVLEDFEALEGSVRDQS